MVLDSDDRRFTDRRTAGRMLADEEWHAPVVLGPARGGVPVAYEVARPCTTGTPCGRC